MNKKAFLRCALFVVAVLVNPVFAQEIKGSAASGEKKINQCIGCHGLKGYHASFPEIYHVPMLFGQNEKYLAAALSAYKHGERKHPTMRGMVDSLSEQDIADIAAYYGNTHSAGYVAAGAGAGSDQSGKAAELVAKGGCLACHGEGFNKPVDPAFPKLAGQHADYLAAALRAYKAEGSALVGRGNAIMGGVAKQFSNEEIRILADYVASLPSDLETVAQSRFK